MRSSHAVLPILVAVVLAPGLLAMEYAYQTPEPQKAGWPLRPEEEAFVLKPEYERRPGSEEQKHMPSLWPVVPAAGFWGGRAWLEAHESLVKTVQANQGPTDVLLVGDSITIQWGASWAQQFPKLKAINIGIGGDKTQNVLWRLDHGGVDGIQPRVVMLMIGNNNMFFTPETGIEAAAAGVKACVANLRERFPKAPLILAKILPSGGPGQKFYEDTRLTDSAIDALALGRDPMIKVLDLWSDFVKADGTLKDELYVGDHIHLTPQGYAVWAERLRPLLDPVLASQP